MTLRFLIGIDGGGTGTRARLCTADGAPLALGEAGPSSLSHGEAAAWQQVLHATEQGRPLYSSLGWTSSREMAIAVPKD